MSYNNYEKFTGKLIIYQHGLGDNQTRLQSTIDKLVSKNPKKNAKYNGYIDLSNVNVDNGFDNSVKSNIKRLKETIEANPNKNIHVATDLNGLDPIEQERSRLVALIKYLKEDLGLKSQIVLVGHSQGGLVNLETAIKVPTYIDQLISINTPYSKNLIANKASSIISLLCAISVDDIIYDALIGSIESENAKKYSEKEIEEIKSELVKITDNIEARFAALADSDYYDDLKKKWDNLKKRPKLHVITSASALNVSNLGMRKRPFDCLVDLADQKDITYDTVQYLIPLSTPCLKEESNILANDFKSDSCGACTYDCPWSEINVTRMLFGAVGDLADSSVAQLAMNNWNDFWQSIKNLELKLDSIQLFHLYNSIVKDLALPEVVTDKDCINYYNAMATPYSHKNAMNLDTCIMCIRSYIE